MPSPLTLISAETLGVIRIEGDDARSFLQGQATPDLRKIQLGDCVFGAFCNAQGRVIANGWFQGIDTGFRLVLARDLVPSLIKRLRMYVLRSKVVITDDSDLSSIWVIQMATDEFPSDWHIEGPMGLKLAAIAPTSLPADTLTVQGESFRLGLIQAGIPLVTAETSERFIPHMLSMDYLGGLSFDKGCYTGQEIVTRTQFLGKVKRSLHRIASDTASQFDVGAPVINAISKESVGEIFSVARLPSGGATGLAVLKNDVNDGAALEVADHRIEASSVAGE